MERKDSALIKAVKDGDIFECRRIIEEEGADVNEKEEDCLSALLTACCCPNIPLDLFKLLVSKGGNVHDKDRYGWSCLILSSEAGRVDILECIMSVVGDGGRGGGTTVVAAPNVNDQTMNGRTALIEGSRQGHVDVIDFLLAKGANIYHEDNAHCSSLIHACYEGRLEAVKLLMSRGADTFVKSTGRNCSEYTALGDNTRQYDNTRHYDDREKIKDVLRKWPVIQAILIFKHYDLSEAALEDLVLYIQQ